MKIAALAVLAALALAACGTEQDPLTEDVGQAQDALAGRNPFTCVGTCFVCVQRSPDKRSCVQTAQKTIARNICTGYTTTASAKADCAMSACVNVRVTAGSFACP
jgi:hypothetical protein